MIELHIFTNCTRHAPDTTIIKQTYDSFCDTFGKLPATIWMDRNPCFQHASKYAENLYKIFPRVNLSMSLSDGYIKALKRSTAEYLFMLEHDWVFNAEFIGHNLEMILQEMRRFDIYHLRFNKRNNHAGMWDKYCVEKGDRYFKYCETPNLSNNPHIINRKAGKYFIKKGWIKKMNGSKGIEDQLLNNNAVRGAIYGPEGHHATVYHTDGRKIK